MAAEEAVKHSKARRRQACIGPMSERAPLPPLSMFTSEKKTKQQQQHERAAPPLLSVRHVVILWTLVNAGAIFLTAALVFAPGFDMLMCQLMCLINHPPLQLRTAEMKDAEAEGAVPDSLALWILGCAAAQAAAGALALLLPSRHGRLRLLLAYAALVATAADHSMWAALVHRKSSFVSAEPGGGLCFITGVNTAAVFIFAVGDLLCFMGLILRGREE